MNDLIHLKTNIKDLIYTLDQIKLENLTQEELAQIARLVKIDELKKELAKKIKQQKIDIEERFETFLKQRRSPQTQKNYARAIRHFFNYLERNRVHPLEARAYEVDSYIHFLETEESSPALKRLYLSACSSFYSTLVRWGDLSHNYFIGARLPVKQTKMPRVPARHEVEYIKLSFETDQEASGQGSVKKRQSAQLMRLLVELLEKTGIRVGAVPGLKFKSDGSFIGFSKGKPISGQIELEFLSRIKKAKIDFSSLKVNTIQINFNRKVKALFHEACFTCHSLRHYFAVNLYTRTKDIYLVKQMLHHSSVTVTENYLRSLNVI